MFGWAVYSAVALVDAAAAVGLSLCCPFHRIQNCRQRKGEQSIEQNKTHTKKNMVFVGTAKEKQIFTNGSLIIFKSFVLLCVYMNECVCLCVCLHLSVLCAVVIVRSASKYQNFGNYLLQSWCRRGCIVGFVLNNQTDATI